MPEHEDQVHVAHLLDGLRTAAAVIALVVLAGLALPAQLAASSLHPSSVGGLVVLLMIAIAGVVLAVRGRSWGRARVPAAILALVIASVDSILLPGAALMTSEQQITGAVGWVWVMLFIDVGMAPLIAAIATHMAVTTAMIAVAGRLDTPTVVHFLLAAIAFVGFQLTVGAAAGALRRVAADAAEAARRHSTLLSAEAVARQLHADREQRYDALRGTVLPLLGRLRDGAARPDDRAVQLRAAQEAARLRRLFAEADDVGEPLLAELRAVVEAAEARGVIVQQAVLGRRPTPPPEIRRALLDEVAGVLRQAVGQARVTLTGTPDVLALGVVARVPGAVAQRRRVGEIEIVSVVEEEQLWTQARWTA